MIILMRKDCLRLEENDFEYTKNISTCTAFISPFFLVGGGGGRDGAGIGMILRKIKKTNTYRFVLVQNITYVHTEITPKLAQYLF